MILVDKREPKSLAEKLKNKIDYEITYLEIGDYQISDDIVIERKAIADLINSLVYGDKRIWKQLSNLSQYKYPILAITNWNERWKSFYFTNSNHIHKSVMSFLASAILKFGVTVLFFDSDEEFLDFIIYLEKNIHKSGSRPIPKLRKPLNDNEVLENILAQIPGIGLSKAKLLLNEFKSLENLAFNLDSLEQINGLGKKASEKVKYYFRKRYGKKNRKV